MGTAKGLCNFILMVREFGVELRGKGSTVCSYKSPSRAYLMGFIKSFPHTSSQRYPFIKHHGTTSPHIALYYPIEDFYTPAKWSSPSFQL